MYLDLDSGLSSNYTLKSDMRTQTVSLLILASARACECICLAIVSHAVTPFEKVTAVPFVFDVDPFYLSFISALCLCHSRAMEHILELESDSVMGNVPRLDLDSGIRLDMLTFFLCFIRFHCEFIIRDAR